jgi:hypothetical protein
MFLVVSSCTAEENKDRAIAISSPEFFAATNSSFWIVLASSTSFKSRNAFPSRIKT